MYTTYCLLNQHTQTVSIYTLHPFNGLFSRTT